MIKECNRGCNLKIEYKGKTEKSGSTGYFESTGIEHTHHRCDQIIKYNMEQDKKRQDDARFQQSLSNFGFDK